MPQLEKAHVRSSEDSVQPKIIINACFKMHRHIIPLQVLGSAGSGRFGEEDDFGSLCSVFFHLCKVKIFKEPLVMCSLGRANVCLPPGGFPGGASSQNSSADAGR